MNHKHFKGTPEVNCVIVQTLYSRANKLSTAHEYIALHKQHVKLLRRQDTDEILWCSAGFKSVCYKHGIHLGLSCVFRTKEPSNKVPSHLVYCKSSTLFSKANAEIMTKYSQTNYTRIAQKIFRGFLSIAWTLLALKEITTFILSNKIKCKHDIWFNNKLINRTSVLTHSVCTSVYWLVKRALL